MKIGGLGEPYCSETCYYAAVGKIAAAVLRGTAGNCKFCQASVFVSTDSRVKAIPYRGHFIFICAACGAEYRLGPAYIYNIRECCLCEKELATESVNNAASFEKWSNLRRNAIRGLWIGGSFALVAISMMVMSCLKFESTRSWFGSTTFWGVVLFVCILGAVVNFLIQLRRSSPNQSGYEKANERRIAANSSAIVFWCDIKDILKQRDLLKTSAEKNVFVEELLKQAAIQNLAANDPESANFGKTQCEIELIKKKPLNLFHLTAAQLAEVRSVGEMWEIFTRQVAVQDETLIRDALTTLSKEDVSRILAADERELVALDHLRFAGKRFKVSDLRPHAAEIMHHTGSTTKHTAMDILGITSPAGAQHSKHPNAESTKSARKEHHFMQWDYDAVQQLERLATALLVLQREQSLGFFHEAIRVTRRAETPVERSAGVVFESLVGVVRASDRKDFMVTIRNVPASVGDSLLVLETFDSSIGVLFCATRVSESSYLTLAFVGADKMTVKNWLDTMD